MGWEKEYEHLRDRGHTWGPGIDDVIPLTEEERAAEEAQYQAFLQKLESYRVPPREKYRLAGESLAKTLPSHKDIIYGKAPMGWREEYSRKKLILCKEAAADLGYSLAGTEERQPREDLFAVKVEQYGYLPDRGGNIHPFYACDIASLEDCLQLVADFKAIGMSPTTFLGKTFHYHCGDTGELRNELESWGRRNNIPLPSSKIPLDKAIQNASERIETSHRNPTPDKER